MPTADPLLRYKAKRNFGLSPEPADAGAFTHPSTGPSTGSSTSTGTAASFVVQKHWARNLHYDFRLELGGTLRSWAVPKGPSLDPKVKRMAVQVEDHPLSYASFEGTIPDKLYGAGKVIVWDSGTWTAVGDPAQGLADGNLKFDLHGHKLWGRWVLVRMKSAHEKQPAWLLIKEHDAFARVSADFSVVDELPDSVRQLKPITEPDDAASAVAAGAAEDLAKPPPQGTARQVMLPASMAAQLATLVDKPPPDASRWACEIKFDGYRLLARIDGKNIKLFTRNGHDWSAKLPALRTELAKQKLPSGWYDGEIVVQGEHGVPDFGALQQAFESGDTTQVVFYVFDLPYFDGADCRHLPFDQRRAQLVQALKGVASDRLRLSEIFEADMASVLLSACRMGLEGVIAKRRDAPYASGRSAAWIKLKCSQRQEFVIGGYTDPKVARRGFGALLLGVYSAEHERTNARGQRKLLRYVGNVGSGFSETSLRTIKTRLDAVARATTPFAESETIEGSAHWVRPTLVAEVSFAQWTREGRLRHAVFRGLRTDKPAASIVREDVAHAAVHAAGPAAVQTSKPPDPKHSTENPPPSLSSVQNVTNPNRIIDPSSGITKLELVRYFALVGELMMVHLRERPVALLRAPDGVEGQLFFQKHADTSKLKGMRQLDAALDSSHPPMLEIVSKQGLLSAAQWNVIEFHTLNGVATQFEHPDRMVFDLDPGSGVPWKQVQEAAELMRAFLLQLGLTPFLKTSGGKGLHVVVPLRKLHNWGTVKAFSHAVVTHMAQTIPQRFVEKSGPKNRVGKVFIDYLRNAAAASTVCAWSARARPGMGISVPLAWSELGVLTGGDHWTVRTVHERLDHGNAAWKSYARAARSLDSAMKVLGFRADEIDSRG